MNTIETFAARALESEARRQAAFEVWLEQQQTSKPCDLHPTVQRQLSIDGTRTRCQHENRPDEWAPSYFKCPLCQEAEVQTRLVECGVPGVNQHCSFDNWIPNNAEESRHLECMMKFAKEIRKGFAILIGSVGTGKTHLAIASMRSYLSDSNDFAKTRPVFLKQNTLLRQLRATYGSRDAKDPIPICQKAPLLVLDELGLSGGGKDEYPMLHEIIDSRYSSKRPTIFTSNLNFDALKVELGERLSDRMTEAAAYVLQFSGPSSRSSRREDYFK